MLSRKTAGQGISTFLAGKVEKPVIIQRGSSAVRAKISGAGRLCKFFAVITVFLI
jgi:hypothetical protein